MSSQSSLKQLLETPTRPVVGFPGYTISDQGEVFSKAGKPMAPFGDGRGYLAVSLYRDGKKHTCKVHNLMGETFIGPKNGRSVEHIDGDTKHNARTNLEYISMSDNYARAVQDGKLAVKLNPMKIYRIRRLIEEGMSYAYVANTFCVSKRTIKDIISGKTWKWVK